MEEELFFTGYCRAIDGSRTVCAVTEDGRLEEADCSFGSCPHEAGCPIAQSLAALVAPVPSPEEKVPEHL